MRRQGRDIPATSCAGRWEKTRKKTRMEDDQGSQLFIYVNARPPVITSLQLCVAPPQYTIIQIIWKQRPRCSGVFHSPSCNSSSTHPTLLLFSRASSLSKQDPILSISFFRIPRDKKRKIARKVRRGEASMLFYFCCQRLCNIFVPFPRSLTAAISDITLRFLLQVEFPRSFDLVLEEELMIDRDRWRKKRIDRVIYIRFRSNKNILYFFL